MAGIKLGRDLNAPRPTGPPDGRKPAPGATPAPWAVRPASEGMGSTEKDRKMAAAATDVLSAKEKQKPSPAIVIAAVVALLILPVALVFAPGEAALDFNPQEVAQEYATFAKSAGAGLSAEKVQAILEDLHRLENNGRKAEARTVCMSLLLSTENNPANPIRKLASKHLNELK